MEETELLKERLQAITVSLRARGSGRLPPGADAASRPCPGAGREWKARAVILTDAPAALLTP